MVFNALFNTAKSLDEEILRQYTKLTKIWEDDGGDRYTLSNLINIPTLFLTLGINDPYSVSLFHGWNLASDNLIKPYAKEDNRETKRLSNIKITDRAVRLPLLLIGGGFTAVGLYEIANGLYSGDNYILSDGIERMANGMPFLGVASSQYVKDSDPKLLQKQSLKDKLSEKAESTCMQPAPVPVKKTNTY